MKSSIRDLVGYGQTPPNANWPKKSKLAINFIVNVEEGSEYSPLLGDKKSETGLSEVPGGRHLLNQRDLAIESIYEYGSRVGFWRLTKLFEKYNALAKEAISSGDKTLGENYLQHADHFVRIIEDKNRNREQSKDNVIAQVKVDDKPISEDTNIKQEDAIKNKE